MRNEGYPPPRSESELLSRARALAGCTLCELGARLQQPPPTSLARAKGWTGSLVEALLGATAASRSEPDFQSLGIELKTIPVNREGRPRESTYVCTVPLTSSGYLAWEDSCVCRKLRHVLWIPVQAEPGIPIPQRRVGSALLWRPSAKENAALRADWEEFMERVCLGELGSITAHHGTWLQVRPKAAHSRQRARAVGESGEPTAANPRGFYLRAQFTEALLRRHYVMPARAGTS